MKKYDEYEISTILWNREKPSHWKCKKAKRVFSTLKELNKDNLENNVLSLTLGGVIRNDGFKPIGLSPKDYSTYQIFEKDELVFKLIDLENISTSRVGIVPERGIMSSAYIRLKLKSAQNIKYFYYQYFDWYKRNIFNGLGAGVRQTLSAIDLINFEILVPPHEEQDQIVRYLDWQTSKINRLIATKKKQIAVLKEYELSARNMLLTKGVDPSVSYQSTESNWMENIPAHWNISRIVKHFTIKKRIAGEEGYAVLSITQQGLKVKDISTNEGQMASNYAGYQFVYPSDFAMNHMDLLTGYIDISKHFGVTSPDYRVFALDDTENCFPEYYLQLFQLCYKRKIFYGYGRGAANQGRWRMPAVNFRNFEIPLPPYEEQILISEKIKELSTKIDAACTKLKSEISILAELKTRLISDVVTGQIDVRDIEILAFELVEETSDEAAETENEMEVK